MSAQEFLRFLINIQSDISEPALSHYWAKRAEVQDLIRQERT
jgi:hypothetical protein